MKKWIICIICGTLVLSSFLAVGTTINDRQKFQTPIKMSEGDYTPILFEINVTVFFNGGFDCELHDRHLAINNWTGSDHNVTIRVNINNSYDNTGSTNVYWRIAEWRAPPLSTLTFFLTHGNVKPKSIPQICLTKLPIEWKAADDNITTIDFIIPIVINPAVAFEICTFVYHPTINYDWSSIDYTPMGM
jgi:hypothetical protein